MKKHNAQAWSLDLLVGTALFMAGFVMFYFYAINSPFESQSTFSSISYDSKIAADLILSEGYPSNWTNDSVISPGIISNGRINQTKLNNFSAIDYQRSKSLLQTEYEYYFNLSVPMKVNGVVTPRVGQFMANPDNRWLIQRVVVYENKPVTFNLYLWRDY